MTISSATRKTGLFAGNNVATAFPFTFKVFSASEVKVVRTVDATSAETTLTLTTDYTVSLNPDQDASPGGTVTLLSALATGYTLVITSNVVNTQSTALTNNGGFYPTVIEDALDRATIQIQQLSEQVDRSVKVPISSTTNPDSLVASVAASAAAAAVSAAAAASSAAAAASGVSTGTLAYTPVNITGDTMTGALEVPSFKVNGSAAITTLGNVATKTTGIAAGNVPLWENTLLNGVLSKSAAYPLTSADTGKLVDCTGAGGWSLTIDPARSLANGVHNSSTGNITIISGTAATIDGAASVVLAPGESCLVKSDGTNLLTVGRAIGGIGIGQTWQNVKTSPGRVLGTTYTNTTWKPICVAIEVATSSGSAVLTATIDGVAVVVGYAIQNYAVATAQVIVQPGATYAFSGPNTLQAWSELR